MLVVIVLNPVHCLSFHLCFMKKYGFTDRPYPIQPQSGALETSDTLSNDLSK